MDLSKNKKIQRTNWFQVYVLIGAGVVCAFQIGKVPPALPVIRNELGLDLIFTGWLIGVYALFAAVFGIFGGGFSDAAGYRRSILFGLSCITIGSFSGAIARDGLSLLIARFIEAVGYLPIVVSVPALLGQVTVSEGDRRVAAGIWGAYMPAGTAIMMLLAPIFLGFDGIGWRGLWLLNALIAGLYILIIIRATPLIDSRKPQGSRFRYPGKEVGRLLKSPASVLLGIFFGTYAGNYLTVFGFLPTMLVEDLGLNLSEAALLAALAVGVNIGGNIFGGWLRKINIRFSTILVFGSFFTALSAIGIFSNFFTPEIRYAMAILYSSVCGIIPGATWSAAVSLAPSKDLAGTAIGCVVQGGNLGTLVLPPMTAGLVAIFAGWHAAIIAVSGASILGVALALAIARVAKEPSN